MAQGHKTGGREKGTPNKLNKVIRETLAEVLTEYSTETFKSDLEALTELQRVRVMTNLFRLILPPMKPQEQVKDNDLKPIVIKLNGCDKCSHD